MDFRCIFIDMLQRQCNYGLFMLAGLMASCKPAQEQTATMDCSSVRNGKYYVWQNGETFGTIIRQGDRQTEYRRYYQGDKKSTWRVEWLDSCRYKLSFLSGDSIPGYPRNPITVDITQVRPNGYSVTAKMDGVDYSTEAEMVRAKTK